MSGPPGQIGYPGANGEPGDDGYPGSPGHDSTSGRCYNRPGKPTGTGQDTKDLLDIAYHILRSMLENST